MIHAPIRSLSDIEALERVPLADRMDTWDVFDLIRRGAAINPDKAAIHCLPDADLEDDIVTITHGDLLARFNRAANLFHDLGIGPTDVVAYLLPTMPQNFVTQIGGLAAGIACCVNWMLEPRQIAHILDAARAKILVTLGPTPGFEIWRKLQAIRDQLPDLRHVLTVRGPGGEIIEASDLDRLMARHPGDRLTFDRNIAPDDVAAYVHSGGTTGAPKLAKLTHRGLAFKCWSNTAVMAHGPDDCIFADYPMFHIAGFFGRGILPLANGMTIVIPSAIGARSKNFIRNYWKLVERFRISYLSGVPTTLSVLLDNPPTDEDIRSLRSYAPTGSTALPPETARRIERELGIRILLTFGATEFTQNVTMTPRDGDTRYGSTGIRLPYIQVKTVRLDDSGHMDRDCAVDEIGLIVVKGPNTIPGYVDDALNENLYFDDGWINSGDLGRIDADGYLWVTGREKDVIIRGGHNIDPIVIEDCLMEHGAVQLVAALGKPDAHAGELPVAYVQLRDGAQANATELADFCRGRIMERAAAPSEIFILDRLPLTDIGKPDKVTLRNDAARRVFTEQLGAALGAAVEIDVNIQLHAEHGQLAMITLAGAGSADRDAIGRDARAVLDRYAIRHQIKWRD